MSVETPVGLVDKSVVEAPFADTGFVARRKQDGLASRVEGEGHAPYAIRRVEPKFLHIGVARSVQRVHPWAPKRRAEFFKQPCLGKQLVLDHGRQFIEFRVEGLIDADHPAHSATMPRKIYAVKCICVATHSEIWSACR